MKNKSSIFGLEKQYIMEITVNVKDSKAPHLLEVLKGLSFVTSTTVAPKISIAQRQKKQLPMSKEKAAIIRDIKRAVKEVTLIKQGKLEARDAREFLNEL